MDAIGFSCLHNISATHNRLIFNSSSQIKVGNKYKANLRRWLIGDDRQKNFPSIIAPSEHDYIVLTQNKEAGNCICEKFKQYCVMVQKYIEENITKKNRDQAVMSHAHLLVNNLRIHLRNFVFMKMTKKKISSVTALKLGIYIQCVNRLNYIDST